jgi:hypothetical protein
MKATQDDETSRLVSVGLEDDDNENKNEEKHQHQQQLTRWKTISYISIFLLIVMTTIMTSIYRNNTTSSNHVLRKHQNKKCMFCDIQSPPTLHEDKSYKIKIASGGFVDNTDSSSSSSSKTNENDDDDDDGVIVTPMTVTYDYELYNGQLLFTDAKLEIIPNIDEDYSILGMSSVRNINVETNEPVSLDEVYVHHFTFRPIGMLGAEVLTRNGSSPYMKFPNGYGLHVIYDETPYIRINAHLLSNKDLEPIDGSISLAHKHCNECYYAPGKGSDCTPDSSGTFKCCGDSTSCTVDREQCACATTTTTTTTNNNNNNNNNNEKSDEVVMTTTKYQIQIDLLISRDIHKFKRVDQWNFAAPACSVNLHGDAVFDKYSTDNFCFNNTSTMTGGGSLFHQIELQEDDNHPYVETKISSIAPASGKIVWAQSHLHTGGVNATLRLNGEIICSAGSVYGTDTNVKTNARNEQNHLIHIESCYDTQIYQNDNINSNTVGINFNEGDVLTTETIYHGGINDDRFVGYGSGGEHKNVMSMFFLGVVFEGDSEYLTKKRTSFNLWNDFVHIAGYNNTSNQKSSN